MDSHPLVELVHMLHRVCSTVVNGEGWLLEPSRKYDPFYVMRERRLGELIQCPAHGIVSQAPVSKTYGSQLLLVAGPSCYFVSKARGYPHESGSCWFEWCLRFPLETFHSLHFDHAQG